MFLPSLLLAAGSLLLQAPAEARPQAPAEPALVRVTEADCADAAKRDALLADPEAAIEPWGSYGKAVTTHGEQLMTWRSQRLIRAGRWTDEQSRNFFARLLEDQEFISEASAGLEMVQEVMEPAMLAGDASKPAAERCQAVIVLQGVFERILASAKRQWAIAESRFTAEEQRLGATID